MRDGGKVGRMNRTTPRATVSPTTVDLAWAAGFLEGEGTFLTNNRSGQAKASQVQREPLERLARFFGGSITLVHKNRRPNESNIYHWSVSGARARGVMMTLFPFLSPRRQSQIAFALHGQDF